MARIQITREPTQAEITCCVATSKGKIFNNAELFPDGSAIVDSGSAQFVWGPNDFCILPPEPKEIVFAPRPHMFEVGETVFIRASQRYSGVGNIYYGLHTQDVVYFLDDGKFYFATQLMKK